MENQHFTTICGDFTFQQKSGKNWFPLGLNQRNDTRLQEESMRMIRRLFCLMVGMMMISFQTRFLMTLISLTSVGRRSTQALIIIILFTRTPDTSKLVQCHRGINCCFLVVVWGICDVFGNGCWLFHRSTSPDSWHCNVSFINLSTVVKAQVVHVPQMIPGYMTKPRINGRSSTDVHLPRFLLPWRDYPVEIRQLKELYYGAEMLTVGLH